MGKREDQRSGMGAEPEEEEKGVGEGDGVKGHQEKMSWKRGGKMRVQKCDELKEYTHLLEGIKQ